MHILCVSFWWTLLFVFVYSETKNISMIRCDTLSPPPITYFTFNNTHITCSSYPNIFSGSIYHPHKTLFAKVSKTYIIFLWKTAFPPQRATKSTGRCLQSIYTPKHFIFILFHLKVSTEWLTPCLERYHHNYYISSIEDSCSMLSDKLDWKYPNPTWP